MNLSSLKASLLPQPPSFQKKKAYQLHNELGAGAFGKVIRATWTKPTSSQPSLTSSPLSSSQSNIKKGGSSTPKITGSHDRNNSLASLNVKAGETRDVALKVIPKKKVKGNEDVVWGEMDVLKGLDHPNIVSHPKPRILLRHNGAQLTFQLRSNSTSGLNQEINTIFHLNSLWVENYSSGYPVKESLPKVMR